MTMLTFDDYLNSLTQLSDPFDPTTPTAESEEIRTIARALCALTSIDRASLSDFIAQTPDAVPVLGLAAGLTREKLKNVLRHLLGSAAWATLARQRPEDLVEMLDEKYEVVRLIAEQRVRNYDFGDVLVARAGTRRTARVAGATGLRIEDEIEGAAKDLGLPCATRTRFEGRNGETAPCDLAIPSGGSNARIVVAAKGFDSTGSKLTDAVREVKEMAEKRLPSQYVMAAVDGIGWKSRVKDFRDIFELWEKKRIDGLPEN
jgi:hypothetical protein